MRSEAVSAGPQRSRMVKRRGTNGPAIGEYAVEGYADADAVWGEGAGAAGWEADEAAQGGTRARAGIGVADAAAQSVMKK
jgi:hypothetical protein